MSLDKIEAGQTIERDGKLYTVGKIEEDEFSGELYVVLREQTSGKVMKLAVDEVLDGGFARI
jgi:hypothetical protein